MKLRFTLLLIFALVFGLSVRAQIGGPSLAAGIEGIVYNKGTLDAELIAEIVAQKQEEIKQQLIKNLILGNLEYGSVAFREYAVNALQLLLNERNKNVMTKELLEYSVNLGLVYGFGEYYLSSAWNSKLCDFDLLRMIEAAQEGVHISPTAKALWIWKLKEKPLKRTIDLLDRIQSLDDSEYFELKNRGDWDEIKFFAQNLNNTLKLFLLTDEPLFKGELPRNVVWYFHETNASDLDSLSQKVTQLAIAVGNLEKEIDRKRAVSPDAGAIKTMMLDIQEPVDDFLLRLGNGNYQPGLEEKAFWEYLKDKGSVAQINKPVTLGQLKFWEGGNRTLQFKFHKQEYKAVSITFNPDNSFSIHAKTHLKDREGKDSVEVKYGIAKKLSVFETGPETRTNIQKSGKAELFSFAEGVLEIVVEAKTKTSEPEFENKLLNHILVDMIYDIAQSDSSVKSKGFFQIPKVFAGTYYQQNNRYLSLWGSQSTEADLALAAALKPIYRKMKNRLELLFVHYELIKETNFFRENDVQAYIDYFVSLSAEEYFGSDADFKIKSIGNLLNDNGEALDLLVRELSNLRDLPRNLKEKVIESGEKLLDKTFPVIDFSGLDSLKVRHSEIYSCLDSTFRNLKLKKAGILAELKKFKLDFSGENFNIAASNVERNLANVRLQLTRVVNTIKKELSPEKIKKFDFDLGMIVSGLSKLSRSLEQMEEALTAFSGAIRVKFKENLNGLNTIKNNIFPFLNPEIGCLSQGDGEANLKGVIGRLELYLDELSDTDPEKSKVTEVLAALTTIWEEWEGFAESEFGIWLQNAENGFSIFCDGPVAEFQSILDKVTEATSVFEDLRGLLDGFDLTQFFQKKVREAKDRIFEVRTCFKDDEENDVITELYKLLINLNADLDRKPDPDAIEFLKNEAIPRLVSLRSDCPELKNLVKDLDQIINYAEQLKYSEFIRDLKEKLGVKDINKDNFQFIKDIFTFSESFVQLTSRLNQLDEVETYEYIFRMLSTIGEMYGSPSSATSFSSIVNNVRKYAEINHDQNSLSIDVESIILDLYNKYEGRRRLGKFDAKLNLSVGVNYGIPLSGKQSTNDAYFGPDDIQAANFVSEKIGVKVILWDWDARRRLPNNESYREGGGGNVRSSTGSYGSRPILSNFHLNLYGSGLLYQISALSSADSLRHPILAAGLGLTFFNGLDAGISYGKIMTRNGPGMLNISFDIQFAEYIRALTEKRRRAQYEKQLIEAGASGQDIIIVHGPQGKANGKSDN